MSVLIRLLVVILLLVSSCGLVANANWIEEGYRHVDTCQKFTNLDEYPDYVFLLSLPAVGGGDRILENDQCFGVIYWGVLYAVNADGFDRAEYEDWAENGDIEYNWYETHDLVTAEKEVPYSVEQVPENDRLLERTIEYKITKLADAELVYEEVNVVEVYREWSSVFVGIGGILLLTIFLEFLVYFGGLKWQLKSAVTAVVFINLLTNPAANFAYMAYAHFWLIEVTVVVVETLLLHYLFKLTWRRAVVVAIVANVVSALVGRMFI